MSYSTAEALFATHRLRSKLTEGQLDMLRALVVARRCVLCVRHIPSQGLCEKCVEVQGNMSQNATDTSAYQGPND